MTDQNKTFTIDNLAKIDANGFQVALFPQIRDAIITKLRNIYGNDIDVSSASADGQFVNMEALIVNNIYRVLENIVNNLNPATATGSYLNIISSLSNIFRKSASYSTAWVWVKITATQTDNPKTITCVDKSGLQWIWINPLTSTGALAEDLSGAENLNTIRSLQFTCMTLGPNDAQGTGKIVTDAATDIPWNSLNNLDNCGDIYQTTTATGILVYQANDCVLGTDIETDASLRSRRTHLLGATSSTLKESLQGALINLDGVQDAFVFNNATANAIIQNDTLSVASHNIYVCVRYVKNAVESTIENDVSQTVYKTLPPGVLTQPADTTLGTVTDGQIIKISIPIGKFILSGTEYSWSFADIYYKKCTPDTLRIAIDCILNTGISTVSTSQINNIISSLRNYFNNILINGDVNTTIIQTTILQADLKTNGLSTYITNGCVLNNTAATINYLAPLSYYDYDNTITSLTIDTIVFDYTTVTSVVLSASTNNEIITGAYDATTNYVITLTDNSFPSLTIGGVSVTLTYNPTKGTYDGKYPASEASNNVELTIGSFTFVYETISNIVHLKTYITKINSAIA